MRRSDSPPLPVISIVFHSRFICIWQDFPATSVSHVPSEKRVRERERSSSQSMAHIVHQVNASTVSQEEKSIHLQRWTLCTPRDVNHINDILGVFVWAREREKEVGRVSISSKETLASWHECQWLIDWSDTFAVFTDFSFSFLHFNPGWWLHIWNVIHPSLSRSRLHAVSLSTVIKEHSSEIDCEIVQVN